MCYMGCTYEKYPHGMNEECVCTYKGDGCILDKTLYDSQAQGASFSIDDDEEQEPT